MSIFDYEGDNLQGVSVTLIGDRLHPLCNSDGEIDFQIQALKDDLDRVAKLMKRAVNKPPTELGLNVSN